MATYLTELWIKRAALSKKYVIDSSRGSTIHRAKPLLPTSKAAYNKEDRKAWRG